MGVQISYTTPEKVLPEYATFTKVTKDVGNSHELLREWQYQHW
jgi:hypothetical protein